MIVYDKEQKEIVIPNGIGNINLYNNGVEAGYNQGYEQGQADMAAKARVLNVTENGTYLSNFSDPIGPIVTGVYADGTEFYSYAELNGKIFNTKIAGTVDSRLEFWYKGDSTKSGDGWNVIIGAGNNYDSNCFQVRYFSNANNLIKIDLGDDYIMLQRWNDTAWHHLIVSKAEGVWFDGEKRADFSLITNTINGEFFINGIGYSFNGVGTERNANGYFGMIKIDDTTIIPTANGFLNTNTGELLEVVKDGSYAFTEKPPIHTEGELYKTVNVNVPDLNGDYNVGYEQGRIDGIDEQKSRLGSIRITENGTYTKGDGYNHIEVNVPDLNGSYDEGYNQGQADVAANARVLNVTENGTYRSKFSDPIIPTTVTGVYADGTNFYNYAELNGKVFNTNIPATKDSRIEFWWKNDDSYKRFGAIIGAQADNIFKFVEQSTNVYRIEYGDHRYGKLFEYNFTYDMTSRWNHIIFSKQDGLNVNGELICNVQGEEWAENVAISNFWINAAYLGEVDNNANGTFGMIKINDTIIIPTADGFQNVNTGELLEVVQNGTYTFTEKPPIHTEGELYKTINVNVIPKINLQKTGLKLGYSTFTEVPEWADFEGITNMENMFDHCSNLQTIPLIDTTNVISMLNMFGNCQNLQTIPLLNTSNVENMQEMFLFCTNLQTIPSLDTSKVTEMYNMFYSCSNLTSLPALDARSLNIPSYVGIFGYNELPNLINFGGFLNLKCSLTNDSNFKRLPNLTYESCINVLNGLYDFTGNGETPNSEQGQLKVAQSFIDKVGNEISIGIAKGWQITV